MYEFDQLQIRKLDGGLLLIFRELLARRRARAVADQLGLSASAISHALARLRDVFADPLFIRRSHGLEPTQRALELGPRIEALIEAIGQAVGGEGAFDVRFSRRRFRIACAAPLETLIGPRLVDAFRAEAPLATFSTRWAVLDQALNAVRRGEVDTAHPQAEGHVDLATYAMVGHVFVGVPDAAFADQTPVDRQAITEAYGWMPPPNLIWTHGYVSNWETAMLMIADTDAMADCPRSLAVRYAPRFGLQVLDPPFEPFRFTVQAVRRATPDAGLDWLMSKLAEAVAW